MKVKDLKVGSLYVLNDCNKIIRSSKINSFRNHCDLNGSEIKNVKHPVGIEYFYIENNFRWSNDYGKKHPVMYLGTTRENWYCNRADWFPIKKRHWCMYKGRKMILDAWSVKHLTILGVENE